MIIFHHLSCWPLNLWELPTFRSKKSVILFFSNLYRIWTCPPKLIETFEWKDYLRCFRLLVLGCQSGKKSSFLQYGASSYGGVNPKIGKTFCHCMNILLIGRLSSFFCWIFVWKCSDFLKIHNLRATQGCSRKTLVWTRIERSSSRRPSNRCCSTSNNRLLKEMKRDK